MSTKNKTHRKLYDPEFKKQAVQLLLSSGRPLAQIARERAADLHRGEKAMGRLGHFERNPRPAATLIGEATQTGFLRGHDGNLRHRENTIRDEQHEKDGNFKGNLTHKTVPTGIAAYRKDSVWQSTRRERGFRPDE